MSRRGSANANWRGGRRRGGERGRYWLVYAPDHPAAHKAGTVLEHRLVAEETLGRLLIPSEVVHHVNGDTLDNRPENLRVMTQAEHARLHCPEHLIPNRYVRPPAAREERVCPICGREFVAVGKRQASKRYCSSPCYWASGRVGIAQEVKA